VLPTSGWTMQQTAVELKHLPDPVLPLHLCSFKDSSNLHSPVFITDHNLTIGTRKYSRKCYLLPSTTEFSADHLKKFSCGKDVCYIFKWWSLSRTCTGIQSLRPMVISPPVTSPQPKVTSPHNRSNFAPYKSHFAPYRSYFAPWYNLSVYMLTILSLFA